MKQRACVLYRAACVAGLSLAASLGMSLASTAPAAAATTHHITMTGFPTNPAFCVEGNCSVQSVTIASGDTVVWNYADGICDLSAVCPGHTASSTGGPASFGSPTLYGPRPLHPSGPTSYSITIGGAGNYSYTCAFHGTGPSRGLFHMDGTIVVRAPASQGAQGSGPIIQTNPGSGTSSSGGFPNGTSNSVASDQLPNTFVPGLPVAGRTATLPSWMLTAAVALLVGAPAFALTSLGLAARRR